MTMTIRERAYVKRLEKRNHDLYVALCIINAWLVFPESTKDILFRISELVTKYIEKEKLADKKETARREQQEDKRNDIRRTDRV